MMFRTVLCLLVIFPAVNARCSRDLEQKRTWEILQKLCNLGEMRPVRCKSEAENMTIFYPEFPKKDSLSLQMSKSLWELSFRFASDLFTKDLTLTKWDSIKLRHLQDLLGEQIDFYQTCLPAVNTADKEVERLEADWRTFWTDLDKYLFDKNYSSCAWESARTPIHHVMRTLYKLTGKPRRRFRSC